MSDKNQEEPLDSIFGGGADDAGSKDIAPSDGIPTSNTDN